MPASDEPDNRGRRRRTSQAAVAVALLGAALLTVSLVTPQHPNRVVAIVSDLSRVGGCLAILIAAAMALYYRFLRSVLASELAQISGPAILAALPPGHAIGPLLAKLYGNSPAILDVVHGVLGGEGRHPGGEDLSISTHTTVRYELRSEFPGTYTLVSTVDSNYRTGIDDTKLYIFATCDPRLRDIIAAGSERPIFDWWYVLDAEIFDESVSSMCRQVQVGVRYRDAADDIHVTELTNVEPRYVPFNEWQEHLTFFRGPMGSVAQHDPRQYMGTLRIYEYDLATVEAPEHPIEQVEGLTLRSATLQSTDDGHCYWQAPYPCFVDDVSFDVAALGSDNGSTYEFLILPFTFRAGSVPTTWTAPEELPNPLPVRSWVLPGHGFALLWRHRSPKAEVESA